MNKFENRMVTVTVMTKASKLYFTIYKRNLMI